MDKKVTMRDIAAACGVSVTTVSNALKYSGKESIRDELRLKIIQTATHMGYNPNDIRGDASRMAAVVFQQKPGDPTEKLLLQADLARELALALNRAGYKAVPVNCETLEQVYGDDALKKTDAWIMVDVDAEQFAVRLDGFFAPRVLLDCEVEDNLYCRIRPDFDQLFDEARLLLGAPPAFMLCEDVCNAPVLRLMMEPFAPSDVFINRPGADLDAFLQRQSGKKGLVHGDILGAEAAKLAQPGNLVVICALPQNRLLPAEADRIYVQNSTKARQAVQTMVSMLAYDYEAKEENRLLLQGVREPQNPST